jgi:hypothetical protein
LFRYVQKAVRVGRGGRETLETYIQPSLSREYSLKHRLHLDGVFSPVQLVTVVRALA